MTPPRVKAEVKNPIPTNRKERAQVLQNLYTHLREEAAALVEICEAPQKAKLRTELQVNAHSLQKTLDTIQRGCL